jgi:2,5-dioxopentanoate dehydrogenase
VLLGRSLIGFEQGAATEATFQAVNPVTGAPVGTRYHRASIQEVDRAAGLALQAWPLLEEAGYRRRAALLQRIAGDLEAARTGLVEQMPLETALPVARVEAELARTCHQLRLFAGLLERGDWVEVRIHHGDAARRPLPRPDLRAMRRPIGPVAVFTASNFPLAFGAAGNDVTSALAAGCPVVVKAHPLHPGIHERVGQVVRQAVVDLGLPQGSFSLLFDDGLEVGRALVEHPAIQGVGFTGSRLGGRALMDLAAARRRPIPVYAEMGSVNPVFVLPLALRSRPREIAEALVRSVTLATGQFCTCPGVVFAPEQEGLELFRGVLRQAMAAVAPAPMIGPRISQSYREGLARLAGRPGVSWLHAAQPADGAPCLLEAGLSSFLGDPALGEEVFGPAALLVRTPDVESLERAADALEGQLTATVWMEPGDEPVAARLLACLSRKAGRVLVNGVPTGVEVSPAMVHGGPYPATADGRSSSVGTIAIERWLRWVSYQDVPEVLLPPELKEGNPLGIRRWVDEEWT